eukprot:11220571-Lingulodinium_polyedra.AAC.2
MLFRESLRERTAEDLAHLDRPRVPVALPLPHKSSPGEPTHRWVEGAVAHGGVEAVEGAA